MSKIKSIRKFVNKVQFFSYLLSPGPDKPHTNIYINLVVQAIAEPPAGKHHKL